MAKGLSDRNQIVSAVDDAAETSLPRAGSLARGRYAGGEPSPHSHKFLIATVALSVVAIAAIAISLSVLLSPSSHTTEAAWSAWSPPDSGLAGERDIANEISPLYRASPASQLVLATVHNLSDTGTSTQLALRDPTSGSLSAISGTSAVYTMCGLGPSCSISTGTPSQARLLLLRREALELALYTFKYINGVDNVVAILPPGTSQQTSRLTSTPPAPGKTSKTIPGRPRRRLPEAGAAALPHPAAARHAPGAAPADHRRDGERARGRTGQRDHGPGDVHPAADTGPGRKQRPSSEPSAGAVAKVLPPVLLRTVSPGLVAFALRDRQTGIARESVGLGPRAQAQRDSEPRVLRITCWLTQKSHRPAGGLVIAAGKPSSARQLLDRQHE